MPLSRGNNICNLQVLAENCVPNLTVRAPEGEPQCAQSPHLGRRYFNAALNDLGGGPTTIDQHKHSLGLESTRATVACAARRLSDEAMTCVDKSTRLRTAPLSLCWPFDQQLNRVISVTLPPIGDRQPPMENSAPLLIDNRGFRVGPTCLLFQFDIY